MAGKRFFLISLLVGLSVAGLIGWQLARYLGWSTKSPLSNTLPIVVNSPTPAQQKTIEPVSYQVVSVVEGLEVPWSLAFTSASRLLVTERPGRLREVNNGQLRSDPLYVFNEVSAEGEAGLMGLTLDPDYSQNKLVYVCYAYQPADQLRLKVVRLIDQTDRLELKDVILDEVPAAQFHAGCRIAFGPDKKLFVTVGDATSKEQAQRLDSLAGKILRLNPDGSIPDDNPFPNSLIYSYGHRNPQGIAWHPVSQQLWATEHGPSGFDGPGGGDEVNLIKSGGNYGWPAVSHQESQAGMIDPKLVFTPAVAPAAALFYTGEIFPQFKNNLLFGALKGEGLILVEIDPADVSKVIQYRRLAGIDVGRVREVVQGPDGLIYFTTSNRDGRAKARTGDDHIYRLMVK